MDFYRMDSVRFCYPKQARLFDSVSISINRGERVGFYGANGTGKTTLTRLMLGILKPQSGSVTLEGTDISKLSLAEVGRKVGYIFQNPDKQLFTSTVYEAVAFGLRCQNLHPNEIETIVKHWLDYLGLRGMEERFPIQLSSGQKQRLVLAATMARGVDFFIMDEPASGLDIYHADLLSQCLADLTKKGKGYIIISHDRHFMAKHVDRKYNFRDGGVVEDAVD